MLLGIAPVGVGWVTPVNGFQSGQKLAPDVPMPQDVVDRMLAFAEVNDRDVVYDLGSGDGRVVNTAARKYGAKGVGIELDTSRVADARRNAQRAGVAERVTFNAGDVLEANVSDASVVTLFLTSSANRKLRQRLTQQLRPGARIVSLTFDMGDWKPSKTDKFTDVTGTPRTLYLWVADGVARP
jgi:tRNA A58 N-methylase Trm61